MWVYLTTGWVVPSWRGKGIGTAMLHWAETRIQELASEHPTQGHWEYASNATNTEVEATDLLRANGYYAAYTVLDMELTDFSRVPEPNLPAGLELRPLTPRTLSHGLEQHSGVVCERTLCRRRHGGTFPCLL